MALWLVVSGGAGRGALFLIAQMSQNSIESLPRFIGCGIGIFGRIEVQPGVLGILLQQALAFLPVG
jgi:hypothetical protein